MSEKNENCDWNARFQRLEANMGRLERMLDRTDFNVKQMHHDVLRQIKSLNNLARMLKPENAVIMPAPGSNYGPNRSKP